MSWLTTKTVAVSFPRWRSLALLLRSSSLLPFRKYTARTSPIRPRLERSQRTEQIHCFRGRKVSKGTTRGSKKIRDWKIALDDKDFSHLLWWKKKLEMCRKSSTVQLIKRLVYSNLLGLDVNLKHGSLKEGTLNREILQFKSRFPREVLLCRVGDFYEAVGIDACILVEYAGLNPCGGLRSDSVPKAGCPVMNLQQTLDDLTNSGYSVCVVEEVQGPAQARARKGRFISGHAHPGSPYLFGHVRLDHDLDFPEPMPVIGISRSAKGYCAILVLETMKTFSADDGLTEEALVTKLRTRRFHHLFLHKSLKNNASGTCHWGEYGEGGLLWAECSSRYFEWFEGDPMKELLLKVKELYGLDDEVTFRNVTISSEKKPRPLHLGTATQIGAIQTEGIPSLLNVLLSSSCTGLPSLYIRDLLLNPPAYAIASTIQEICKCMGNLTGSVPEFTCLSSAKLVKLLELREANHIDFCKIKDVSDEVLQLYNNSELRQILKLLMDPTWAASGLKIDFDTLVNECEWISLKISEIIDFDGENDRKKGVYPLVPGDFFEDVESTWKGRIKRMHMEELCAEVEQAARDLHSAISEDFLPIVSRVKATTAPYGGPKGEILYAREHGAVWFRGKRFAPSVWAGTHGEKEIRELNPALDSKGRKVGEEWFTTKKVENALMRYHEANDKAREKVLELLQALSAELQSKVNILVFASMLLVIAKALFSHVSEGRRKKWVFPTLVEFDSSENGMPICEPIGMQITGLTPYWFDVAQGTAVPNSLSMQSLFLLTGPNGGGKSSLLRSLCAAALLGICGFMVPAESALIPHFDAIILHMKSYDSPVDGKSSFQIEMSEVRSLLSGTTSRSLVLMDEICRGTETAKGTCIAGSIIETLDATGCLGVVSTHLHGIFDLPLCAKKVVFKSMGAEYIDGQIVPTWKLMDGICRESLAFETAEKEGIPRPVVKRAEELYHVVYQKDVSKDSTQRERGNGDASIDGSVNTCSQSLPSVENYHPQTWLTLDILQKEAKSAIVMICQKKLIELYKMCDEVPEINCVSIAAREQPPPSTIGASSVYVMLHPDRKIYVGQTDDLQGRVRAHRAKEGMQNALFIYFLVPGKSLACQLETLLINQLPDLGFHLTNIADGKHRNFGTTHLTLKGASACR